MNVDLFGNEIVQDVLLRDKFIEPPFSIIDTKQGKWQARKKMWIAKGLRSEVGRDSVVINMDVKAKENNTANYVSVFDPALCEVLYRWFCVEGGGNFRPFCRWQRKGYCSKLSGL